MEMPKVFLWILLREGTCCLLCSLFYGSVVLRGIIPHFPLQQMLAVFEPLSYYLAR